jgi:3-oxoacyl-[acyl-carrier protein] reductase
MSALAQPAMTPPTLCLSSVINVASAAGLSGAPGLIPYGAAKAGVISVTKTLAVEWAPSGIRVLA